MTPAQKFLDHTNPERTIIGSNCTGTNFFGPDVTGPKFDMGQLGPVKDIKYASAILLKAVFLYFHHFS